MLRFLRARLQYLTALTAEEAASCGLFCALILGAMVWGALLFAATRPARGQDFDRGLDLPVAPIDTSVPVTFAHPPTVPPEQPPENGDDKPPVVFGQEIKSDDSTLFYALDVSGSMGYDRQEYLAADGSTKTGSRLDREKAELARSIASLPESVRFNALAYDCGSEQLFSRITPASTSAKAVAIAWVNRQSPGGGTGTGPACVNVLREHPSVAVLLSDGDPNCVTLFGGLGGGISSDVEARVHREMIRAANGGTIINTFGISCYGAARAFMQGVASDNGGTYTDVR